MGPTGGNDLNAERNALTFFLCLDFADVKLEVACVILRVSLHCKASHQRISFIKVFDDSTISVPLPTLDKAKTSLSTLTCDVQILLMISTSLSSHSVEYRAPVVMRSPTKLNAAVPRMSLAKPKCIFSLKWTLDGAVFDAVKESCADSALEPRSFESETFYSMFRLRCYPNVSGAFAVAIQLMALPEDVDIHSGLDAECILVSYEATRAFGLSPKGFKLKLSYFEEVDVFPFMRSSQVCKLDKLQLRAQIVIL